MKYLVIFTLLVMVYLFTFEHKKEIEVFESTLFEKDFLTSSEAQLYCNEKEEKLLATRNQIDIYYQKNKNKFKNPKFFYAKDGNLIEVLTIDSFSANGYSEYEPETKKTFTPRENTYGLESIYTLCVQVAKKY